MSRKKDVPYVKLTPRKQRDAFVRLRSRILRDTPVYGGHFASHEVLEESGGANWGDFLFLGRDGRTIWNAEIRTAGCAFTDKVEEIAQERAWALMSEEEMAKEFHREWEPVSHGGSRLKPREPRRYAQFDGLTLIEYEDELQGRIIKTEPPSIRESYRLDRSYQYGIGLYIIVDAETINRTVIEDAIRRFHELNEAAWESEQPVARDRLPFKIQAAQSVRIAI